MKKVYNDFIKISVWSKTNRLSVNVGKTKYLLSHKSRGSDDLPLKLRT